MVRKFHVDVVKAEGLTLIDGN